MYDAVTFCRVFCPPILKETIGFCSIYVVSILDIY
jgi:hypothetical protein